MTRNVHAPTGGALRPAHALLLATAFTGLALAPARAETLSVTGIAPVEGGIGLAVPAVEIVDGNLDEAEVRALFSGAAGSLAPLATLNATSVIIPELILTVDGGPENSASFTYRNLVLEDVVDGVAASATVDGADFTAGPKGEGTLGEMSVGRFDIAGLLGFYGLAPSPSAGNGMRELYADFSFAGGTFSDGEDAACTIGAAELGSFSARPLRYNFSDIQALVAKAEAADAGGAEVPPEDIRQIVLFYADLLQAFSSSPVTLDGIECSGKDEKGQAVSFSLGTMSAGGFEPARYPAFSFDDFAMEVTGEGHVTLDNFTWKQMDFSTAIATIEAAATIDEAFFEQNWRQLVPAMDGLSLAGLDIDVPDTDNPAERVTATLGAFDATLGNYVNGIPADISLRLANLVVPLTAEMTELPVADLLARGIDELDISLGTSFAWDEATSTIAANDVTIDLGRLGRITLSGTFGNATPALFGDDDQAALLAAQAITLRELTLEIEDRGIGSILIATGARDAGQPEAAFRTAVAGMAQGLTLAFLGNTPEALMAAQQLGNFLLGASHLELTITSRDEAGIGLADLAAAETNPAALAGKITVVAVADGEPVTLPLLDQPAAGETVEEQKRNLKKTQ